MTGKTSELMTAPIFALFFFARFVPFATPIGAAAGAICGVATATLIAFSGPTFGMDLSTGEALDPISFMWVSPASLSVSLTVGTLVSLISQKGSSTY